MPSRCIVPKCRSNYNDLNRVHIFRFPKDEELQGKWLRAIRRPYFLPSKYCGICHAHFKESDILWETSETDWETGNTLTSPMLRPRLTQKAVPSIFPNFHTVLTDFYDGTEESTKQESHQDDLALQQVIEESPEQQLGNTIYKTELVTNLYELKAQIINVPLKKDWSVILKEHCVMFLYSDIGRTSHRIYYIIIDENLEAKIFSKGTEIKCNNKTSTKITNVHEIEYLIEQTEEFIKCKRNSKQNFIRQEHSGGEVLKLEDKKVSGDCQE